MNFSKPPSSKQIERLRDSFSGAGREVNRGEGLGKKAPLGSHNPPNRHIAVVLV